MIRVRARPWGSAGACPYTTAIVYAYDPQLMSLWITYLDQFLMGTPQRYKSKDIKVLGSLKGL